MPTQFSVATWNLERPAVRSWKKLPAIRRQIATVSADVWVLTETRRSISPGDGFQGVHSPPHPWRREDPDERWVSIWSRWPTKDVRVRESFWAATALVDAGFGPIIVHGVVLPYRNEPSPNEELRVWAEFSKELLHQSGDWLALRRKYPTIPLVVAGDFNQSLDGELWYGNADTRRDLGVALNGAGLCCVTTEDVVESGKLKSNHLVDHICVSAEHSGNPDMDCWDPVDGDGVRMSDHPGVVVRLSAKRSPLTH